METLKHEDLDMRVAAFENLRRITGVSVLYFPEAPESSRRRALKQWEDRLEDENIVFRAAAPAADSGDPDFGDPDSGDPDSGDPDPGDPDPGDPDPQDPEPSPWVGSPVLLGRFAMRRYFLMIGWGMFWGPIWFFCYRRPSGYMIGAAFIFMLIGLGLLLQIPYI